MSHVVHGSTQWIRLSKVSVPAVRIAKAKAALAGRTLEDLLTELLEKAIYELDAREKQAVA